MGREKTKESTLGELMIEGAREALAHKRGGLTAAPFALRLANKKKSKEAAHPPMIHSLLKFLASAALIGIVASGLGGCREEEMGRPLFHDKGSYTGPADEPLAPEVRDELRRRINGQRSSGV